MKNYTWFIFHYGLLISLLTGFVWLSGSQNPLRIGLQNAVFDQFNKLNPRDARNDVVIVDIDDASLKKLGQWPWSRKIMAELTMALTEKGAKSIAFDGVFAEKDRTSPQYYIANLPEESFADLKDDIRKKAELYDYDAMFANTIKASGIFVTAFTYARSTNDAKPIDKRRILARSDIKKVFLESASRFDDVAVNLYEFEKNAAGNGSFMARPDADGVLRRAGMIFTDGKTLYPALSLEAVRVGISGRKSTVNIAETPQESKTLIDTNYRIVLSDKDIKIPVENDGIVYVYYRYFCNEQDIKNKQANCHKKDYISAYKLLNPEFEKETTEFVKGKIVLIGASAEGLKDLRNTSLQPFRPGVEVHANVVEQILSGQYLLRPSMTKGVEAAFIIVVGLGFIILSAFIGVTISLLLCLALIGVACFGAYFMYVDYGLLLDPVYPSISVFMIFMFSTLLSYARAEAKRKQIRNAFGMYVATDVMRDLEANPEKLSLGGEIRDITVMFTDIRRFTSISEGLKPEELIQLMNDFLTAMTDTVMDHQGTIDKYIGDAMMCFWNAPKDIVNHQRKACSAALKMQGKLLPINQRVKERALELGKEPILLHAGIGINSGECAVGNMGSKQRFAYSALGDGVNIASRLEGLTKEYGVPILVGQSIYENALGFAFLEIDTVRLLGKKKEQKIFALIGDEDIANDPAFISWKSSHDQMINEYRRQNFENALRLLKGCKKVAFKDYACLYDVYENRMRDMIENPPNPEWNGVYTAKSK